MTGFYKAYRVKLQPQNSKQKFTLDQAYHWLASNAAWGDHRKKVHSKWITVRTGMVISSVSQLSLKWNRDRATIKRYLIKLEQVGVLDYFIYNKRLRTLEIFLSKKPRRYLASKNQSQLSDNSTTIPNNKTPVLQKIPQVPLWVNLENPSNFKDFTEFSTVVYNKEEEVFNTNTNTVVSCNKFNTLKDNFMKSKDNPFTLVPNPSSTDLRSENVATAETKKPPSPFLTRIGEAKPYPRDTDSPVLLTDKEVFDLTDTLGGMCLMYQVTALAEYAQDHPRKFAAYKNHYRVILRWDEMKQQKGLVFCCFHSDRPGYYPEWIYQKELEKRRKRPELVK